MQQVGCFGQFICEFILFILSVLGHGVLEMKERDYW